MIQQWQTSGLTQREFCIANNIVYHVFHYWYGVYRSKQQTDGTILPIKIQKPSNSCVVELTQGVAEQRIAKSPSILKYQGFLIIFKLPKI